MAIKTATVTLSDTAIEGVQEKFRIVLPDGQTEFGPYDTEEKAKEHNKALAEVGLGGGEVRVILTCSSVRQVLSTLKPKVVKPEEAAAVAQVQEAEAAQAEKAETKTPAQRKAEAARNGK